MKKIVLLSGFIFLMLEGEAQTFAEWFKQKKTQIKYLVKQIEALQVYKDYLEKGYNIAREGCAVISHIRQADLTLHQEYFSSLRSVKPAIRNYSRIKAILTGQAAIIQQFDRLLASSGQSGQFSTGERTYIHAV